MKKLYIMLLAILCCVVSAYAFEIDGISYRVTQQPNGESPGEVQVTGGEIREVIEFPESVTYNEVTYTVTSIGNSAFSGRYNSGNCTKKYIIPETVRTIGSSAFYDNYYLEEVEFNEGLQTIGNDAFGYNFQLKEIRIPSTVTSIEGNAFRTNQQNKATISCLAATPPSIQSSTFQGRTNAALHVVVSDVDTYKETEYWKDFSEITGDILYSNKCFAPKISLNNGLLTMSCATEGATIYYTTDGSKPDENAIRYTSPISYTTNQIIRAIAIAEGYENSSIRNFYDEDYIESITNVIDEQGVYYTFGKGDYCYSVIGHSNELSTEIVIPANLNGFPVGAIGNEAFYGCSSLTSVTIPSSITTIGKFAFYNCSGLLSITIPNSVTSIGVQAFYGCSDLTTVKLGSQLTTIGEEAFGGCRKISSITIPSSVTSIDTYAFRDCDLNNTPKKVEVKVIVTDYSEFCNNIIVGYFGCGVSFLPIKLLDNDENEITEFVIPEGVTTIGQSAFTNCRALTYITIPNSVTSIGNTAFEYCSGLTSITIPNSVTSIGEYAFSNCSGLTSITIPNSVDSIGNSAFYECSGLTSITIPNSVTSIGEYAFSNCSGLTSVTIPKSVTSIGDYAFQDCSGLTSVTIPNSVTSIGNSAFYECSGLTSITIPNSVTSIGEYAFSNCSGLTSVTLSNQLTTIGKYAFNYNTSLLSIIIPNSVTSLGEFAFATCSSLASVTIGSGVKSLNAGTFYGCSGLNTIQIPNSLTSIEDAKYGYYYREYSSIGGTFGVFSGCSGLTSVTIGSGVRYIGWNAFSDCNRLTFVKLPESLTSMGEKALPRSMNSLELPNSFTVIPENLFSDNYFQYIKLGNNVKSIGKNAFGSSSPVIVIDTPTPPAIASDAFPNVEYLSDLNVIVPDAKAETAYRKAAVWQEMTFSNQNNISEVTVETPGDLSFELITQCNMMPAKVVGMKVNGTINADDFNQMLVNMKSLLRLDLSDCNITAIPDNAMKGKMQLKELILPTKLQTIGQSAFQGCTFLSALTMQNGLQTIGKNAFQGCTGLTGELNLPSTLTTIGESAFVGTDYSSVKMPSTLKTIGNYAFNNVPIKQQLTLPKKVTSVGASAFAGTKITGLEIPDGVTSIGDNAFANTPIEGHVTIPDGVTYLGKGAFRNSQLSTVFLPNSVTELSQGAFQGCPNLNLVYVPDNYTGLSSSVFDGCGALQILRLSANLTSMGSYSLQNTPLEYIKVPSQVEVLSQGVLRNCKSLESLSLPSSLKTVEGEALYGCTALRNLSIEAIEPPVIKDRSAIRGINTDLCLISIPTQSYRKYVLAEYWGQFVQMRNDISVETEGNGEIAFESVNEEEEEEEDYEAREYAPHRARRRAPQLASDDESMAIANNGSSIYVPQQGQVRFYILPAEGEKILSATLDGVDIIPYIVDGVYTATADKRKAKLVVKFSGSGGSAVKAGDVNGDGDVDIADAVMIVNRVVGKPTPSFVAEAADVNNDGDIDIADAVRIVNLVVGKIPSLTRQYNYFLPDPQ